MVTRAAALLLALTLVPSVAAAQAWDGRVLFSVNAALQVTASTFEEEFTYAHPYTAGIAGEEATVETRYQLPTDPGFDAGVAVRLFGNLGAGVAFTQTSGTNDIEVTARIPHPLLLRAHRQVQGTTPARHDESAVHIQAVYVVPVTRQLRVMLAGGPTRIEVEHRFVNSVSVAESYPFDTAEFTSAEIVQARDSAWGFNASADVAWMFNRNFGVGGLFRYAAATVTVAPTGREAQDVDAGGFYVAVGARLGF